MRNIRISRRYLKAAAAIDILALVLFNIFAVDDAMWLTLTLALPIVLFFVAFRFPDMAYSEALAGVCTFIVILAKSPEETKELTLGELLPYGFGKETLAN